MKVLNLKTILREKNISNSKLAQAISVTPQTISNIISERTKPNLLTLEKIAHALNIDLRDLFVSTKVGQTKEELIEEIELRLQKLKKM